MLSIRTVLATAERTLSATSRTPRLDAEILLAHVLGYTRAHLLAASSDQLDQEQVLVFQRLITRRAHNEPVAYLTHQREFYGLDLFIDTRVLVPRPETELLVDLALIYARHILAISPTELHIADVGTGSGAIALALAANLPPQARIYATDISADALEVAAANVARHGHSAQVRLLQGDLLAPLPEPVHLIVSNPPYTVLSEIDAGVRDHEPSLALDGGSDGLELYRRLMPQAASWLRGDVNGCMLLEIGATQAAAVLALAREALPQAALAVHKDLAGHDRVIAIETPRQRHV
jgi:release factor glutamine methyltransferase